MHPLRMRSFSSGRFFCESTCGHLPEDFSTRQKKIEAEYSQDFLIFGGRCIISIQSCLAAVSTFYKVTLENMLLFL